MNVLHCPYSAVAFELTSIRMLHGCGYKKCSILLIILLCYWHQQLKETVYLSNVKECFLIILMSHNLAEVKLQTRNQRQKKRFHLH